MGDEAYAKLEKAVDQIQAWWLDEIMEYSYEQGWITDKLWKSIKDKVSFHDFQLTEEEVKEKRRLVKASGGLAEIFFDEELTPELAQEMGIPYKEGYRYIIIQEKNVYAPFIPLHHFANSGVTRDIRKQIGTLSEAMDPFYAMLIKGLLITKAAYDNGHKRDFANHAIEFYPKDLEERTGVRVPFRGEQPKPGETILHYKEQGKKKELIIPKAFNDMFVNIYPSRKKFMRLLKLPNTLFRALVIVYNTGFQLMNMWRDQRRLLHFYHAAKIVSNKLWAIPFLKQWSNMRIWGRYLLNLAASYKKVKDIEHPKVSEMMEKNLLLPNFSSIFMSSNQLNALEHGKINHIEHMLAEMGAIITPTTSKYKVVNWARDTIPGKTVITFFEFIKQFGDGVETMPKLAAYDLLKPLVGKNKMFANEEELHYAIRNYPGTPYYMIGGLWKGYIDSIWLFFNIFVQGARKDFGELGGYQTPFEKGKQLSTAWIYSRIGTAIFTVTAPIALMLGLIKTGDDEEEEEWRQWYAKAYRTMSRYDIYSYVCVPIGMITWDNEYVPLSKGRDASKMAKAVYLRIPKDETQRWIDG